MLSGVSILNFSDFRNLLSGLRSRIGFHLLHQEKPVEEIQRWFIFFSA